MHELGQRCQGMGSGRGLFTGPIQSRKVREEKGLFIDIFILHSINVVFSVHIQSLSSLRFYMLIISAIYGPQSKM